MTAALAFLVVLTAQTPPAAQPTPEAIAQAVRQLGDADFNVREKAAQALWTAGPAAEAALREGLKSADAEVVARCRDLLDKIPYGITPDTPQRFVELIAIARAGGASAWPKVVPDLLDLGPRGVEIANRLIDRLATGPGQRDEMRIVLDREGWRLAPALLTERQFEKVMDLLERGAIASAGTAADVTAIRHYAAFISQRGQLEAQVPRWRGFGENGAGKTGVHGRLPDGAPDGRVAQLVLAHLARLHGDWPLARSAVEKAGHPELREAILLDQGAWADLAALPAPVGQAAFQAAGLRAIYADLAGKTDEGTAAVNELKKMPLTHSTNAPPTVFRALMYARRPADALACVAASQDLDTIVPRFEILCQQQRYEEAFKLIDRPIPERSPYRWQADLARIRIHHQRGEMDKIRDLVRPLTAYDTIVTSPPGAPPNTPEAAAALNVIDQLVSYGMTAEVSPIGAALLAGNAKPEDVFGRLFPKSSLAAEIWWRYLRAERADESPRTTMARLPALLDDRLATTEGSATLEAAAKQARTRPPAEADRWLRGLGEACQAAGQTDAAKRFYEEATTKTDSVAAWLKLGDFHATAGRWSDAATAYEKAVRKDLKQPLPLWLSGFAKKRGGAANGTETMEIAHTISLGDEDIRAVFVEELVKRLALGPEVAEAIRRERKLIVRLAYLARPGLPNQTPPERARTAEGALSNDPAAYEDCLEAAACTQRYLIRMLKTNAIFLRHDGYLSVLHRYYADRARGLLAKGDVDGALGEAAKAQEILPDHVSPATFLVPELARIGKTAEADKLFASVATVLDKLCRDFPNGAVYHNNRAWLAARGRRDLDAAVPHARKAVELMPKTGIYQETLAELHFQRGEKAAALERIQLAIDLDPRSTYFIKQKQRIEAGDPKTPLPEGR